MPTAVTRQGGESPASAALTALLSGAPEGRTDIAWPIAGGGKAPTLTIASGIATVNLPARYRALEPQSNYAEAADYAVYDPAAWYSGSGSNFETVVGSTVGLVQQGLTSPQDAVAGIRAALTTYSQTANPL